MNLDRNPNTQFGDMLQLVQGRPFFTADFYALDGVSGKVASFIDWNDFSHTLAQAISGSQVAVPATHADFSSKLCANFTGAQYYVSNGITAKFRYLSDGYGFGSVIVFTPVSTAASRIFGTRISGAGMSLAMNADTTLAVFNAGPTNIIDGHQALTANVATYIECMYMMGLNPQWTLRLKSALNASGIATAAPSAASPETTLVLGGRSDGSSLATFRFRSLVLAPFYAATERTAIQTWIQADTGITP